AGRRDLHSIPTRRSSDLASEAKVVAPANTTGKNGTTVVIGKDSAKKTLKLYEDPRCPICATFEQSVGPTLLEDNEAGKYKIQFRSEEHTSELQSRENLVC